MAFFKFPWLEQKAPIEKPGKGSKSARAETVEVMRRRARHRLIGAALLVVLAVVGFPVLFDTQPRPAPADARIEIPDRERVAPLVIPADTADAAPQSLAEKSEGIAPVARTPAKPPIVENEPASKPGAVAAVVEKPRHVAAEKPTTPEPVRAEPKAPRKEPEAPAFVEAKPRSPSAKKEAAATERAAVQQDSERARAILEARSGKASAPAAASAPSAAAVPIPVSAPGGERFIVQVGAFSDDAKAREARSKLERGGVTSYTQAIQTKDGKRTRVRAGPFQGRDAAEKAAAKIKALGLPAAVLTL